jgi:hypothetical protein
MNLQQIAALTYKIHERLIENGKIYTIDKNGNNKTSVAFIDGGYSRIELAYILTRIGLL